MGIRLTRKGWEWIMASLQKLDFSLRALESSRGKERNGKKFEENKSTCALQNQSWVKEISRTCGSPLPDLWAQAPWPPSFSQAFWTASLMTSWQFGGQLVWQLVPQIRDNMVSQGYMYSSYLINPRGRYSGFSPHTQITHCSVGPEWEIRTGRWGDIQATQTVRTTHSSKPA